MVSQVHLVKQVYIHGHELVEFSLHLGSLVAVLHDLLGCLLVLADLHATEVAELCVLKWVTGSLPSLLHW